jgi:hypothetical protein
VLEKLRLRCRNVTRQQFPQAPQPRGYKIPGVSQLGLEEIGA